MSERRAPGRKILVVGNYPPDGQESMLRYTQMLVDGLRAQGEQVETIAPVVWFGWIRSGTSGAGKWVGYLDKYLLFPRRLRKQVRWLGEGGIVHIVDHSNAMYARAAGSAGHPVVVTCHDLGAVRGALGEDTDCPASRMGKLLQAWIARSLSEADAVPCVSTATQRDVQRLIQRPDGLPVNAPVIFNGLHAPYRKIEVEVARERLQGVQADGFEIDAPFVLNVGSGLSRKNRGGVLRIFAQTRDQWPKGWLVFAGEALTEREQRLARELSVADRVVQIAKPSNAVLEALYNRATCLLFPSKFEGFGWPVVEAQACGCPVLCSDAGSLKEVASDSAFVRDYRDEAGFAAEILRLARDESERASWSEAGEKNVERFGTDAMIEQFRRLYAEISVAEAEAQEAVTR